MFFRLGRLDQEACKVAAGHRASQKSSFGQIDPCFCHSEPQRRVSFYVRQRSFARRAPAAQDDIFVLIPALARTIERPWLQRTRLCTYVLPSAPAANAASQEKHHAKGAGDPPDPPSAPGHGVPVRAMSFVTIHPWMYRRVVSPTTENSRAWQEMGARSVTTRG